jgi:DNA-binding transcriptional LysR family regulator
MELRVLQYFLVVAREENITKAASLLHITQPTLSRQLMSLEEELGVKLFRRGKHSIVLTEDGMLLRRRAQEIVDLAEKTAKELMHGEEAVSGEISIGCGETQNMKPLAEIMASFQQKYPDVSFHIYTAIADDVKERLENGTLDMGLLLEPVEISRYHYVRMPLKEKCAGIPGWRRERRSGRRTWWAFR